MFKHILVAVDGTATSGGALSVAAALANESKGTLNILHVVDERLPSYGFAEGTLLAPTYTEEAMAELRANGQRILAGARRAATTPNAKINPLLIGDPYGDVASVILAEAGKVGADLIVLGTHGRRGLARVLMGSDAETVLREASIPVLLVRAPPGTLFESLIGGAP